jgi:hypothetical protein
MPVVGFDTLGTGFLLINLILAAAMKLQPSAFAN